MSHIITVEGVVDREKVIQVAHEQGYEVGEAGEVPFYGSNRAYGLPVQLPGWRYPMVVQADGTVAYDNWGGRWGAQVVLDNFLTLVWAEQLRGWAAARGGTVQVEQMADGTLKIELVGVNFDAEMGLEVTA